MFRISLFLIVALVFSLRPLFAADVSKQLQQIGLEKGLSQGDVRSILQDNEGFIWIGTHQGLNLFNGYQVKPIQGPDNILQLHRIDALYQDKNDLIWVGTLPNRNFVIDKQSGQIRDVIATFPPGYNVIDSGFNNIVKGENGDIWLLTYQAIFQVQVDAINKEENTPIVLPEIQYDFEPVLGSRDIIRSAIALEGFLFVGTSSGLYRIDTKTNERKQIQYLPATTHSASTTDRDDRTNVKGLTLSNDDKLLIATVEGLYQVDISTVIANTEQSTIASRAEVLEPYLNIWQVVEEEGFKWLATNDGLYKLTESGKHLHLRYSDTIYQIIDNNIQVALKDYEGNLWLSSRNDGAFIMRPIKTDFTYYQAKEDGSGLSNNMIWGIKQDSNGAVWVGTDNGLNKIDPQSGRIQPLFVNTDKKVRVSGATVYDIELQGQKAWLATQNGIKQVDINTNEDIRPLYPPPAEALLETPAYDITVLDDRHLFIINNNGLFTFNTDNYKVEANEQNIANAPVKDKLHRVLQRDVANKTLLISKPDELVKYSLETGQYKTFHALPPADQPRTVPEGVYTSETATWISYPGFGIYVVDNATGAEIAHLNTDNGLPDNSPYELLADNQGHVWATSNSGLARINMSTFHVRVFQSQHGFTSNEFNGGAAMVDDQGQFWLGGIKGVNVFDPLKLSNTTDNKQAVHNHITGVNLLSRSLPSHFGAFYDHEIELNHQDFGLELEFSALNFANLNQLKYQYWIEGAAQTQPTTITTNHLFLPKLDVGKSVINISAIDYETGQISKAESLTIIVKPAPYLSWYAYTLYFLILVSILSAFYIQYRNKRNAMAMAHAELQASEERLQLALTGGGSGMWEWLGDHNQVYDPRIGQHQQDHFVPLAQKFQRIHQEDIENYNAVWQAFISNRKDVFEAVYRMRVDNKWRWFKDLARASKYGETGTTERVSGTYTDISEIKENQDKITLFSEAFQATRDSVVITDDHLNVIDANSAFFAMSGFSPEHIIGKTPSFIFGEEQDMELLTKIVFNLMAHDAWEGEANLACANDIPVPVIVNTTKFQTSSNETRFVFALTDILKQKLAEAELKKQANYDSLTGLPNRALLSDRLKHAIVHHKMANQMFAVCFIDLDNFKQINDSLGHDVGDKLLKEVARVLQLSIRDYDSVARLGGDEFVLVLEELDSLDVIHRIAQKIIDEMASLPFAKKYPIKSSPSIGIATFPADGDNSQALMKNADMAMYHAKRQGRNNFQFFEGKMNEEAHAKLTLENQLKLALEQDQFSLVYQPKIELSTGRICGFEALARWHRTSHETVPPGVFIPVLEEMGLIIPLTEQLLDKALDDLEKMLALDPNMTVALNFSAKHLQNYDLPSYLEQKMKARGLAPKHLDIELTETVLMDDIEVALDVCNKISALGFNIALDDFGTGYSSFKYLSQLPITTLKIDRSFVAQIGNEQGNTIVDSILSLAKKLNICAVAEGIETPEQVAFLQNIKCDKGQGFYFAKPADIDTILASLN